MGKLPSYDEFVEVMKAQKEQVFENLEKTPNLEWFLGRVIRRHIKKNPDTWWLDKFIAGVLTNRHTSIESAADDLIHDRRIAQTVRKGIDSGYKLGYHLNDRVQELIGLQFLKAKGFTNIDICAKGHGVKRPDYLCRRHGDFYVVEVTNMKYPYHATDLIGQLIDWLHSLCDVRDPIEFKVNHSWENVRILEASEEDYIRQCHELLYWALEQFRIAQSEKDPVRSNLSRLYCLDKPEYNCQFAVSPDCLDGVTTGLDRFETPPSIDYSKLRGKFEEVVLKKYNEQCREYIHHQYGRDSGVHSMVLVNVETDKSLWLNQDHLFAELEKSRKTLTDDYDDLEVQFLSRPE